MIRTTGVTSMVKRAVPVPPEYVQNDSAARLRGEFEHWSHEVAVNRYMSAGAVLKRSRANRVYRFGIIVLILITAIVFALIL